MVIPKDEYDTHHCIRELRSAMEIQKLCNGELQNQIDDLKHHVLEHKRELTILKVGVLPRITCL